MNTTLTWAWRPILLGIAAGIVVVSANSRVVAQTPPPAPKSATAKAPQMSVTVTTKPAPPVTGDNQFDVTVTGADKKPVTGAAVTVLLQMPAMPSMNMPEMKNTITLRPLSDRPADAGKYTGKGPIMMNGQWNVTVSVKVADKEVASKKLTLTAK